MSTYRSPFERLRARFDDTELECRQCGYFDDDANWRVMTSGSRVRYQFVCPSCAAVENREMRL